MEAVSRRFSRKSLEVSETYRIFAPSNEEIAERMTTFMAFVVVSSLKITSHHSSDVMASFFMADVAQ
jgi:hypothetical protein